jgi:kynurenine formamidase
VVEDYRAIGGRVRNWGRWGHDDRLGTLNLISPRHRLDASRLVTRGDVFDLGLPLGAGGLPQRPGSPRPAPIHLMLRTPTPAWADGMIGTDDLAVVPLQGTTQWDGLGHCGYDGYFYNGVPADSVTAAGSSVYSLDQLSAVGVAGRGVLLDIARLSGQAILAAGRAITVDDLEAAERSQGVRVGEGDILLVRTGWIEWWTVHANAEAFWSGEPGIDPGCADWLRARSVAALLVDNFGVELIPAASGYGAAWPLHCIAIRDMGMTLGELVVLTDLAGACAAEGRWAFLFVAPPLKIERSVGSPITPLAIW